MRTLRGIAHPPYLLGLVIELIALRDRTLVNSHLIVESRANGEAPDVITQSTASVVRVRFPGSP